MYGLAADGCCMRVGSGEMTQRAMVGARKNTCGRAVCAGVAPSPRLLATSSSSRGHLRHFASVFNLRMARPIASPPRANPIFSNQAHRPNRNAHRLRYRRATSCEVLCAS